MRKERVLIVHNYYQISGGEDTVVENEKKMLEDNGHNVFMYTRHNNEINEKNIFKKLFLPFETIYSIKTMRDIRKIIKEKNIDVVHVHNTFPLISPSVYKISKKLGTRVVQTIHNFRLLCPAATFARENKICEECLSNGLLTAVKHKCYRNSKIQTIIIVLMLKINRMIGSYKKVDAYITLTEFNKEKLSLLIQRNKIFIKPNFCEITNIPIIPIEERKYFMFLGRLDKFKGINLLVEAWKEIKDEELIIVGTGPEEEYLKNFIRENNMKNIKLIGYKKKEEAMKLLSKAKALIIPSQWYEGFPMTIVESMNLETFIIASDIGNIGNIIENGINGIKFNYKSKEDLIKKIMEFKKRKMRVSSNYIYRYTKENNYETLSSIYKSD